jgi:hypothetical protein
MERYEKIKVIGKGSYGSAILVKDKETKRKAVIKVRETIRVGGHETYTHNSKSKSQQRASTFAN